MSEELLKADPRFLRANWIAERVGWICIAAIVVAALSGAFGRGPLGKQEASDGLLHVEYDRVMRRSAPGRILVHLGGHDASPSERALWQSDSAIRLWSSQRVLMGCAPQRIIPTPVRTIASGDTTIFTVAVASPASGTTIAIDCSPDAVGRYVGAIGIVGGPQVSVRTLVLP